MNKELKFWTVIIAIVFTLGYVSFSPLYFKAKKRSRATKIVNDARIYEAAIDQWAIETGKVKPYYGPPIPGRTFQELQMAERLREARAQSSASAAPEKPNLYKINAERAAPAAGQNRQM